MGVNEHLPAVEALIASGRPCVGLDLAVSGDRASYVSSDNRAGASAAVHHLAGLGHTRIATIAGPAPLITSVARLNAYRDTMADLGLAVSRGYVQEGDFFFDSGATAMKTLLALKTPPTAVFVAGDHMAMGAMAAVADAGLSVPGDISIVGYDDIEGAAVQRPALTTVAQDYLEITQAAVTLLLAIMDDESHRPEPAQVPGRLLVRASTSAPRRVPAPTTPKPRSPSSG
jgi:LacI family transcriptional regulator